MSTRSSFRPLVQRARFGPAAIALGLFVAVTMAVSSTAVYQAYLGRAAGSGLLPAKIVGGYWQMWEGPNVAEITANAPQYNLQYAAFAMGNDSNGHVSFDPVFESGANLKNDIAASKARGSLWLISVGGGSDTTIRLTNEAQAANMFDSLVGIIDSYGFQGVDLNLECGSGCINPSAAASLATKLKTKYGQNFIMSVAPRPFEIRGGGLYAQIALAMGSSLDLVGLQFYDFPEASNTSQLNSIITSDLANITSQGIPASKLLIGCITYSGYQNGHNTVDVYKNIVLQQQQIYPALRGVFVWETSLDKLEGWSFAHVMGPALGAQPTLAPTPVPTAVPTPVPSINQAGNLLSGKTFTSTVPESTAEAGHPLSYLTDGNQTTRWISQPSSPVAVTTDLGASYTLSKVSVLWAGDTINHFQIQLSADNATWTTIAAGQTNNTSPQYADYTSFSATPTGRYFRIVGTDRWNGSYGNSIWEAAAYGVVAAGDTTAPVVSLTAPAPGAALKGIASITGTASDNTGVTKVELLVDGAVKATNNATSANFTWNTTGVADGSHTIALRATDAAGNSASSAAVAVTVSNTAPAPAPSIQSFSATPDAVTAGGRSTLNWVTTGVAACSISPGGPQNTAGTSWQTPALNSAGTVIYTLTCQNSAGAKTSQTATVAVANPITPPAKPLLVAGSTIVSSGSPATLSWTSTGATGCTLTPGNVIATGATGTFVTPGLTSTTTYRVSCRNAAGSVDSDPVTVLVSSAAVQPSEPKIVGLFADPARIAAGQSSTLYWTTTGVAAGGCNLNPSPLSVAAANGSWTTPYLLGSKNYTLTCVGSQGQVVSRGVSVVVNDITPSAPASSVAPTTNTSNGSAAMLKAADGSSVTNAAVATTVSGQVTLDPSNVTSSSRERTITKVEYYEGGTLVQTDSAAPFTLDSAKLNNGTHTITERTYFNDGSRSEVTRIITTSNNAKAVAKTSPAAPAAAAIFITLLVVGLAAGAAMYFWHRNRVTVSAVRAKYGNTIDPTLIN